MSSRFFWGVVGLICLAAAFAGYRLAGRPDNLPRPPAYGTWLPHARTLEPFHLTDSGGHPFTRADLKGHITLVYFGFTHCPDECPDTLSRLSRVRRAARLPRLEVLFVSIDPQRDTPAVMAQYLRQFDPRFIGLTGDAAQIDGLARSLGVDTGAIRLPGGGYTFEHTLAVFLFDADAREAAVFTPPFQAARLASALRGMAPRLLATP